MKRIKVKIKKNNETVKTVTYSRYEDDIIITLNYPDGGCANGEFMIVNTHLGFQLQAYYDSWKNFESCADLFELLSRQSMSGITMKQLAEMIRDIGYKLEII